MFHFPRYIPAIVLLLVSVTGCSSSGSFFQSSGEVFRDPGRLVGRPHIEKNVMRIVTIWEPAHGKGLDDRNARGFAGQILFFGPRGESGARVSGKVQILLYDNYDKDADTDPVLLHRFEFDADAWEAHHGEGTLGHSYSVFIPYMNKHKDQVNCALKVELLQEDGSRVSSQETEVLLPGRNTKEIAASRTRGFVKESSIGGAKSDAQAAAQTSAESKLSTLSIPLKKR
jgi:hypothetical protein